MSRKVALGELIKPAKVKRCGNDSYPVLSMTMHNGIVMQSDRFKKELASKDTSNYKVVRTGQLVEGFPIDEGVIYIQSLGYSGIRIFRLCPAQPAEHGLLSGEIEGNHCPKKEYS